MNKERKYKLSVPMPLIPAEESYFQIYLEMLKEMGADRVFLFAPPMDASYMPELREYREWSEILREKIGIFRSAGISTAFWMAHTIGHGGDLSLGNNSPYQQITGPEGKQASGCYCPLDKDFRNHVCASLAIMADSGVELIMLDDDFRVNLHKPEVSAGCFCKLHMDAFKKETGLDLSRDEIVKHALCGRPNEIREKWLDLNGTAMLDFAGEMEKVVHSVDKNTRFGLATAMTLWSNEGVDMRRLLEVMAGGTKPFLRTIGAPYWSKDPSNLSWVVEYNCLQKAWSKEWNAELMAEGDTFPHTRFHCSASSLHAYQQGLFASGYTNILNYSLVYLPKPDHEQGYFSKVRESMNNYDAICRFFPSDYLSEGIYPVCTPNNFMNIRMPEDLVDDEISWPDEQVFVRFLSGMGIPITYEGTGPVFLSGYGAAGLKEKELDELLIRGAVVDSSAAEWLLERSLDIGLEFCTDERTPVFEYYFDEDFSGKYHGDRVWLLTSGNGVFKRCRIRTGAKIISEFCGIDGMKSFPSVILYENEKKQRFCIFAFDIYKAKNGKQLLYNYARQEQLTRCINWVGKKPLPVSVNSYPDIHVVCRKSPDGRRTAIAVQNFNLDPVIDPELRIAPDILTGEKIELLLPDADVSFETDEFQYINDGEYGYLRIKCEIPPMGMLGVGLNR